MGRMTRAKAAEVAEQLHVDPEAVLELPSEHNGVDAKAKTPEPDDKRTPLGEIATNSGGSKGDDESDGAGLRKSTRGRKAGKKGSKSRKIDLNVSTATQPDAYEDALEAVPCEREEPLSLPATEAATESTVEDALQTQETSSSSPSSSGVRLTRSQLSKASEQEEGVEKPEPKVLVESGSDDPEPDSIITTSLHIELPATDLQEPLPKTVMDTPPSPLPSAVPNVIASLRKDTPGKRSTSNKENVEPVDVSTPAPARTPSLSHRRISTYDTLEAAVVGAATPPGPSRQPSSTQLPVSDPAPEVAELVMHEHPSEPAPTPVEPLESISPKAGDPIAAMDALDEAVEKVAAELPVMQDSPQKSKAKKAAPVVRTTKASQARISLAQADKSVASKARGLGKPRPSTALGRSGSVRQSVLSKPDPAGRRVPLVGTKGPAAAPEATKEKRETVIPHSKPRPVSLSFPTPPPPPKSKKAPTQSTFQLPGEAVAAKLKAAREERAKREAEEEQKKVAFKARPVPAGLKKAPSVRQTTSSKARESMIGGKPASVGPAAPGASHKRADSVAAPTTVKPRTATKEAPRASIATLKPKSPEQLRVAKRASTAMPNTSKPRASLTTSTTFQRPSSGVVPASGRRVPSGKGTSKGKEVFSRAAAAKDAAEKEKREKEDAAKRARAAASERGRQASREWAEKQKQKKLGLKPEVKPAATEVKQQADATVPEGGPEMVAATS